MGHLLYMLKSQKMMIEVGPGAKVLRELGMEMR